MQKNFLTLKRIFYPSLGVLTCCSLLIAVGVALKTFSFTIPLGAIVLSRIGFQLLPTYLSAILFGPFLGGIVGFLTDFLSMLVFPVGGGYNPMFGITYMVAAIFAWLIFYTVRIGDIGKFSPKLLIRIIITVIVVQLIVLFLNTLWTAIFYGTNDTAFTLFLIGRSPSLIFYIPLFSAILSVLLPVLIKPSRKLYK